MIDDIFESSESISKSVVMDDPSELFKTTCFGYDSSIKPCRKFLPGGFCMESLIWQSCYDDNWQGKIVSEAFSHPAKFSRGLIHRIYQHAKEMEWVNLGDYILDPFGGVALGGLDAMSMGLNWIGVELEEKFVKLGEQNIALWNHELSGWSNLGTAGIVQGDSRRLGEVIRGAKLIVSSPPYAEIRQDGGSPRDGYKGLTNYSGEPRNYWRTQRDQNNLGNMPEGNFQDVIEKADLVVSSPPYAEGEKGHPSLGSVNNDDWGKDGRDITRRRGKTGEYGHTPGNLANLKEGSFELCVSSPPYETGGHHNHQMDAWNKNQRGQHFTKEKSGYGKSEGQVGGDTFWSASLEIVQQCFDLLKPNGHAIWVTKRYVKNKKIVEFSDRWLALCESVGFRLVCRHQAMLVKDHGTQITINGEKKITTERKSFFRRLAESKGSPRIDWEDIICVVKE